MNQVLKIILWFAGIIVAMMLIVFVVGYLVTRGNYEVPATVDQNPDLPSLEINDTRLHAEAFGNDTCRVVIVIHGGPGNDYRYLLPLTALADRYYVVFYDQRGSGLSERVPVEEITLDIFVEDLKGVIDHYASGDPVYLIGHSWGAMLATDFLGRYPDIVDKVVLAEPGFLTSEMGNELMEKTNFFQPEMTLQVFKQIATIWFRSLHVEGPDAQASRDLFMEQLIFASNIENHPMAGYYCEGDINNSYLPYWRMGALVSQTLQQSAINEQGKIEISFIEGIENFTNKVLFISGSCNTLIGPEYQQRQMNYFPDAELVVIQDAGHSMIGEKPAETLASIRAYFKD
jgi:proline iminopeptidase